jgi:hypothetical protein
LSQESQEGTDVRKILALCAILTISGCSTNGGNYWETLYPSNWFGGNKDESSSIAPRGGYNDVQDRRPVVGQIVKVDLERTSYGLILEATASLPNQGYYVASLVQSGEARSDQLVFEFRAVPPRTITTVGSPQQRELSAAVFLSDQTIRGIREIVVIGATNRLSRRP